MKNINKKLKLQYINIPAMIILLSISVLSLIGFYYILINNFNELINDCTFKLIVKMSFCIFIIILLQNRKSRDLTMLFLMAGVITYLFIKGNDIFVYYF